MQLERRQREREQQRRRRGLRTSAGRRRTRSTIAPQIRPSPSSRRSRPTSGTRSAVDVVAEPREQRGQDGQRAEHRDARRRGSWRAPSEAKVASPVRNMPAIADHHGQAGDEHRAAGGRGGGFERRPLAAPGGALLRARASSRTSSSRRRPRARSGAPSPGPAIATGSRWLGSATSPNVAKTAVSASSSGMPAATSAPNASTRMISVIGSESVPAFAEVVRRTPSRRPSARSRRRTRR